MLKLKPCEIICSPDISIETRRAFSWSQLRYVHWRVCNQNLICSRQDQAGSRVEEQQFLDYEDAYPKVSEHYASHPEDCKGILNHSVILIPVIAALLDYLEQFRLNLFLKAERFTDLQHLQLSANTISQLDLEDVITNLDRTKTPGGRRLFRYWMTHPLIHKEELLERRSMVQSVRGWFYPTVSDLERGLSRIQYGKASPKEVSLALRNLLLVCKLESPLKCESPRILRTFAMFGSSVALLEDILAKLNYNSAIESTVGAVSDETVEKLQQVTNETCFIKYQPNSGLRKSMSSIKILRYILRSSRNWSRLDGLYTYPH